jgi:hypothetical protein
MGSVIAHMSMSLDGFIHTASSSRYLQAPTRLVRCVAPTG